MFSAPLRLKVVAEALEFRKEGLRQEGLGVHDHQHADAQLPAEEAPRPVLRRAVEALLEAAEICFRDSGIFDDMSYSRICEESTPNIGKSSASAPLDMTLGKRLQSSPWRAPRSATTRRAKPTATI